MEVSVYDGDDNGNENRVCFWLRLDAWQLREAAMVLVDIDPDGSKEHRKKQGFESVKTFGGGRYPSIDSFGFPISLGQDDMANDYFEGQDELAVYQKKYDDMCRILYNLDDIEYDKPSYWIERAISKKVNIPWLEFAIRKGFYVPKQDDTVKQVAEKPLSVRTENNYLRLIMALANGIKDFNPTKPYEAAKLIIDETGIENISQETIAGYISKAHALDSKEKD